MESPSGAGKPKVLVLVESTGPDIAPITFELLRIGKDLASARRADLCAAVLGNQVAAVAGEIARFCDEVYAVEAKLLAAFQVDVYAAALLKLCQSINPIAVLMSHTPDNLDVATKLSCRLGTQLITDCVGLGFQPDTGNLLCTKPVYGGNAVATFEVENKPVLVTLRSNVAEPITESPGKGKVTAFPVDLDESMVKVEVLGAVAGESVSLDKADAIVSGGRGIGKIEGLKQLEELAKVLKKYFNRVELGASRPLIDNGWLPSSRQLGLTGEKASPQLYFAIGISGSSQHMSGISGSKRIVAINKDSQASIFKSADYGVVGEYESVVPALVKKLKELT